MLPVDDPGQPTWLQRPPCLAQQSDRILDMQDVEQHRVADAGIGTAATFGEKVAPFENDVGQSDLARFLVRRDDHLRFDVQREDSTGHKRCGRNGERSVPASELHYIAALTSAAHALKDSARIEERCPDFFNRHSAFSAFHNETFLPIERSQPLSVHRPALRIEIHSPITLAMAKDFQALF